MLQSGGPLKQILILCDICAEEKPVTEYIHQNSKDGTSFGWNVPVPPGCLQHLAPQLQHWKRRVCLACLRAHVENQLQTQGALNISCVYAHDGSRQGFTDDRGPYAQFFLSPHFQAQFGQESVHTSTRNTNATVWKCPAGCGYGDGILLASRANMVLPTNAHGKPTLCFLLIRFCELSGLLARLVLASRTNMVLPTDTLLRAVRSPGTPTRRANYIAICTPKCATTRRKNVSSN